jgi:hypothetical protein
MQLRRPRILRLLSALTLAVIATACDAATEPVVPLRTEFQLPQLSSIGAGSFSPNGYLGITAEPADTSLRFSFSDVVEMTVVSPTGDSVEAKLGRRYCNQTSIYFRICHEYVLMLDTTVAFSSTQQALRDAGYGTNTLNSTRFVVVFDLLWRSDAIVQLTSFPAVGIAGANSIGWLDQPPTGLAGRGLYGAIEVTTDASSADDDVLSIPETGFVTVRYRQPDGTTLTQQISVTPRG